MKHPDPLSSSAGTPSALWDDVPFIGAREDLVVAGALAEDSTPAGCEARSGACGAWNSEMCFRLRRVGVG